MSRQQSIMHNSKVDDEDGAKSKTITPFLVTDNNGVETPSSKTEEENFVVEKKRTKRKYCFKNKILENTSNAQSEIKIKSKRGRKPNGLTKSSLKKNITEEKRTLISETKDNISDISNNLIENFNDNNLSNMKKRDTKRAANRNIKVEKQTKKRIIIPENEKNEEASFSVNSIEHKKCEGNIKSNSKNNESGENINDSKTNDLIAVYSNPNLMLSLDRIEYVSDLNNMQNVDCKKKEMHEHYSNIIDSHLVKIQNDITYLIKYTDNTNYNIDDLGNGITRLNNLISILNCIIREIKSGTLVNYNVESGIYSMNQLAKEFNKKIVSFNSTKMALNLTCPDILIKNAIHYIEMLRSPPKLKKSASGRKRKSNLTDKINKNEFLVMKPFPFYKDLLVGPSQIHGMGVYTPIQIQVNTFIMNYIGEIVGKCMADKRERMYQLNNIESIYMFQISEDMIVDATLMGNKARFINHSCNPNCEAILSMRDKSIKYCTVRDIEPGEELTINYNMDRFENTDPSTANRCNCGDGNCFSIKINTINEI